MSIGSIYAFSLFVTPLTSLFNVPNYKIQICFSLAIFFLGMSAAFGGKFVENNVRKSMLVSTACFVSGLLVSAFAVHIKSINLLYFGYGVLMGIGLGVGYISPVKTLLLWFDGKHGLASGIAITGFGFASAIASPLINYLKSITSVANVFLILSIIYFVPMIIACVLIKKPTYLISVTVTKLPRIKADSKMIIIWLIMFLNISCGLALISIASPILEGNHYSLAVITTVIGTMGVFNGTGRLVFATLSDYLKKRKYIYLIIFTLSIISVLSHNAIITLLVISACYGAGFACLPPLLSKHFGMNNLSTRHGLILSAWGIAGLLGNQIINLVGNYNNLYVAIIIMYAAGLLLTVKLTENEKEI